MLYISSCFLISYITNNFLKNQYFNNGLYFNKQICLSLLFRSYYSLWLYDGGKKYSKLKFKFYTLTILRENFETFNLIRVKSVGPEMKLQIATFFINLWLHCDKTGRRIYWQVFKSARNWLPAWGRDLATLTILRKNMSEHERQFRGHS